MSYLGNSPVLSQQEYRNIDDISGSFNGSTTSFALLVNGVAPVPAPQSSNQCLISVNGVIQKPDDTGATGFRLSGGNIVFSAAPTGGQAFFGVILAGADYIYAGQNYPDGTVSAPSITFAQDLDTGFYRSGAGEVKFTANGANTVTLSSNNLTAPSFIPTSSSAPTNGVYLSAANTVAIATNSTGKLFINSSGQVGIGTSSPSQVLDVQANDARFNLTSTGSGQTVGISIKGGGGGGDTYNYIESLDSTGAQKWYIGSNGTANTLAFKTNGNNERMRIDSSGRVGIGTTSPVANRKLTIKNDGTNGGIAITNTADETVGLFIGENVSTSQELGIYSLSNMRFYTGSAGGTQRAAIDTSGRLLVGTSSTSSVTRAVIQGNSAGNSQAIAYFQRGSANPSGPDQLAELKFADSNGSVGAEIAAFSDGAWASNDYPGRLVFSTTADGASSPTERMRITNGGYLKATSTGDYAGVASSYHESRNSTANNVVHYFSHSASSGASYGIQITYSQNKGTSTGDEYIWCSDSAAVRMSVRGNGGIANYSANNVNLSDINAKKDITPAAGTWDCIKEWEIVNFRYKNQPDDADLNLGVIAQQVAESCPEVITVFEEAKDDQPEKLGVKEQQMYWMAIKALQEAQVRIEALEAEVAALKAQ